MASSTDFNVYMTTSHRTFRSRCKHSLNPIFIPNDIGPTANATVIQGSTLGSLENEFHSCKYCQIKKITEIFAEIVKSSSNKTVVYQSCPNLSISRLLPSI